MTALLSIVEKAFAVGDSDPRDQSVTFDYRTKQATKPARVDLVTKTMAKMVDDPSAASMVYSLYGGSTFPPSGLPHFDPLSPPPDATTPVYIDTARIEAIQSNNR